MLTITEEIERIKNLNKVICELDYSDSDPRSRGSYGYRPGAKFNPNTDYLSDIGSRKKKRGDLQEPTYNPFSDTGKSTEEKPSDINNKEDRMSLAKRVARGDEIKNATQETLKQIRELYNGRSHGHGSGNGKSRDPEKLDINIMKPFHIEVLYFLLKRKEGTYLPEALSNRMGNIVYSKTFMSLVKPIREDWEKWGSKFKFKDDVNITLDDFVKFMQKNMDLIIAGK